MADELTILRHLFVAARERDPSLTQEKFAHRLNTVATAKGYRGFSAASVSTMMRDAELHHREKFPQYKVVMRGFAETCGIGKSLDQIFQQFENERRKKGDDLWTATLEGTLARRMEIVHPKAEV